MPASLKFVLGLLFLGMIGALASGVIQHRETIAQTRRAAETMTGGGVDAGQAAIARYGCGACHFIPGVVGGTGRVGPSLRGVARRAVIAGRLPNNPENLTAWIRQPQHVSPGTAMPEQGVSAQEARDIAAYLYTLR
jgi:cytochrome c2